jgi:hypothetical protein
MRDYFGGTHGGMGWLRIAAKRIAALIAIVQSRLQSALPQQRGNPMD